MHDKDDFETVEILLVEDNPAHADMMRETLKESRIANRLSVVTDGEMALDFLYRKGPFAESPRPGLILLDLGLPRKTGLEVLSEIKEDPELRRIPVIVLTTSESEEDILKSYDLHANTFISKPVRLSDFMEVIRSLENYWFVMAQLPKS
ncbi:response regulator [Geomonas sp. RF6]|uniref:response regulator n=1 Tax=Geomonas sp. RF6 TaxID=2897342 RepID=UPI001E32974C|nr:response regulator [Geomonas sp. RF6]UFS69443.1 response regulator [Geomonas sp. RF6]